MLSLSLILSTSRSDLTQILLTQILLRSCSLRSCQFRSHSDSAWYMLWKTWSYFIQNYRLFLECFFAYEVLRCKRSRNSRHLRLTCACQISTIDEAVDDETNNDVDVHEIWWYKTSELIVSRQTLFKFEHVRRSSLLANIDVSVYDVTMLTWEKYCIWRSLKVCLSVKRNDVQFVVVTKMTVLSRSSVNMSTWERYCIWLFSLSDSYAETCSASLIDALKLSHDDDEQ